MAKDYLAGCVDSIGAWIQKQILVVASIARHVLI